MSKKDALDVVSKALQMANKAGVFGLQDSATVFSALTVLSTEDVDKVKPKTVKDNE